MRKSRYLKIAAQSQAQGQNAHPSPKKGVERGFLVLVDAVPIRAAATTRYRQAKEKFSEAQRLLARFQEKDKPKFERWLQEKFRDLVTDLRSSQGELNRLRELIFEVETRTWFNNQSCAAAYRDVLERKARRRDHPNEPPPADDLEEKMRAHLEAEARDEQEEAEGRSQPAPGGAHRRHLTPDKEARLKAAYRAMARRLHPDRSRDGKITPQMRERWHEAQQAYMAGDVELLESIESLCADEEGEVSADTPVSLILERTGRLVASLTQLANKMVHHRKEPAWAFSVLKDFSKIERVMAKSLPGQIKTARAEIAELEEKISQWKADAERFYPGFKEKHEEHHAEEEHAKKKSAKASAASASAKEKEKPKAHAFSKGTKASAPAHPAPKAKPAAAKARR